MRRLLILLLAAALLMSGCWGRREIDELDLIVALGLDRADDGQQILVTAEIAIPGGATRVERNGEGQSNQASFLISTTAPTVFAGINALMPITSRLPFLGYVRAVVIGEELAREGMTDVLDFISRDDELRRATSLFIARGATASDVLGATPTLEPLTGFALPRMARWQSASAVTIDVTLTTFLRSLSSGGIEAVVPTVRRTSPTVGGAERNELRLEGAALFRGDRVVRFLSPAETRGMMLVRGMISGAAAIVADTPEGLITFETIRQSARTRVRIVDGEPEITVSIQLEAMVMQQPGTRSLSDPETVLLFQEFLNAAVVREVEAAVEAAQHPFASDVFGFGREVNRQHPAVWQRIEADWPERFSRLPVAVEVSSVIRRSGMRARPVL